MASERLRVAHIFSFFSLKIAYRSVRRQNVNYYSEYLLLEIHIHVFGRSRAGGGEYLGAFVFCVEVLAQQTGHICQSQLKYVVVEG
jgi:hypothetical protein